ncbi:MAG: hypothetical protein Q9164_004536, partial [Protoblastenia rupestris]
MVTTRKANGIVKPNSRYSPQAPIKKVKAKRQTPASETTAHDDGARTSPNVESVGKANRRAHTKATISPQSEITEEKANEAVVPQPTDEYSEPANALSLTLEEEIAEVTEKAFDSVESSSSVTTKNRSTRTKKSSKPTTLERSSQPKTRPKAIEKKVALRDWKKRKGDSKGKGKAKVAEAAENVKATAESNSLKDQTPTARSSEVTEDLFCDSKRIKRPTCKRTAAPDAPDVSPTQSIAMMDKPKANPEASAPVVNLKKGTRTDKKGNHKPIKASDLESDKLSSSAGDAEQASNITTNVGVGIEQKKNDDQLMTPKRKVIATNTAVKKANSTRIKKTENNQTISSSMDEESPPKKAAKRPGRPKNEVQDETSTTNMEGKQEPNTKKVPKGTRVQDPNYRHRVADDNEDEADHMIEDADHDPEASHPRKRPRIEDPTFHPQHSPQSDWNEPSPQSETHASVHPARNSKSTNQSLWKGPTTAAQPQAYANNLLPPPKK